LSLHYNPSTPPTTTLFPYTTLFRSNNGDGTFTDVTRKAGVYDERIRWGAGCTWLDYDRDGRLDLFVCNYIKLDPEKVSAPGETADRKSTRLNSSHVKISYAVFCLKK